MRLLLDEMWSHEIAAQLRRRGHDVIAATEPEHAGRYSGIPDDIVFERARHDRRVVVTDNVSDYELVRIAYESAKKVHHGVVYALAPEFDRHRGSRVIGPMVDALDGFLTDHPSDEALNAAHYLRRRR